MPQPADENMAWLDRYNVINESQLYSWKENDISDSPQLLVLIFRAYFIPFIFILGIGGNIISLITFIRLHRRCPARFNLYAIAITCTFVMLLIFDTLLDDFLGRGLGWLTGYRVNLKLDQVSSLSCKIITYITDSCGFMATTILSVFGLDRVRTICLPFRFRGNRHVTGTVTVIIGVVIAGMALFAPTLIFYDIVQSREPNLTSCTIANPSLPGSTYMLLTYVLGSYTIPTVIIVVCNVTILFELGKIKAKQRNCGISVSSIGDTRRIIGHLAINTAFLFLMIPLVVVVLLRFYSSTHNPQANSMYYQRLVHLSRFFSSLLSIYSASTFWVFFIFLPSFRDAVYELLLMSPVIARSSCGAWLYKRMTFTGARRFRTKSATSAMVQLHLDPIQSTGKGNPRPSVPDNILITTPSNRTLRSVSTPSIFLVKR